MSSAPKFVNPWIVDSENVLGDRPDGEVWNFDFEVITDYDKNTCVSRVLHRGGTEAEGLADWARQVDACTPNQKRAYDLFRLAMMTHQKELLVARRRDEDEALQLANQLAEAEKDVDTLKKKESEGETAKMREDAAIALEARRVRLEAAAQAMPLGHIPQNQGIANRNSNAMGGSSNNLKSYFTVDGLEVLTDVKGALLIIGNDRSIYRTFTQARLKMMVGNSGIGWSLEQALQVLIEEKMAVDEMIIVAPTDPRYALTFWSKIEGNPGFMDKSILEKLLRMQFMITDGSELHYLMFYPYDAKQRKVYDMSCHTRPSGGFSSETNGGWPYSPS
jgi:hypothetical protein